jgi:hypothetical protein
MKLACHAGGRGHLLAWPQPRHRIRPGGGCHYLRCAYSPGLNTIIRSGLEEEGTAAEEDHREEAATSPCRASSSGLDPVVMRCLQGKGGATREWGEVSLRRLRRHRVVPGGGERSRGCRRLDLARGHVDEVGAGTEVVDFYPRLQVCDDDFVSERKKYTAIWA